MFDGTWFILIPLASLILFWLRATIDQRKGVAVEVLAVTTPLVIVTGAVLLGDPAMSTPVLGVWLTPFVVFIFWSMPLLVAARIVERLWQREQPQLADMFRITTVTALGIFVLRQLEVDPQQIVTVLTVTLFYVLGDVVAGQRHRWPWAFWFIALLFLSSAIATSLVTQTGRERNIASLIAPIIALMLMPHILHWAMDSRDWFLQIGAQVQALRLRMVRSYDSIYHRTLFRLWRFRPGVCYLNHGSFGAVPLEVQRVQRAWQERCMAEPMDVLSRETQPGWQRVRDTLAAWLGTPPDCLALCANATEAMNEVAHWFPLSEGDEVLLTDHEYGAVKRIWMRRANRSSAVFKTVTLPMPFDDPQSIVEAIVAACNDRTRIVVFSHITSPTAVIMPVAELCRRLRELGIASCIDGPHALLQERVKLNELDCDFYTASCHKWLCAPLGSGCLYVNPRWADQVEPLRLSWGLLPPSKPDSWTDELTWVGTRDYSPYMAIPSALAFFRKLGLRQIDDRNHELALYARRVLSELLSTAPVTPDARSWMGWMAAVWLPEGDHSTLQNRLWQRYRIEVPIVAFADRYLVRVSCHLYNTSHEIDRLAWALREELSKVPKRHAN